MIRLVSLVGCPGTGKTWCGWLVAYTLQQAGKKTLHLTVRNSDVTAIANFEAKKQYKKVSWNENMLEQVLRESKCQVCILDVSMNEAVEAGRIFTGIQQLIERNETEFGHVKLCVEDLGRTAALLFFFPGSSVSNAKDKSFAEGIMSARPEPRSDFVIKCSAEHVQEALGHEPRRCAGSAFEVLVHLFWREAAANKQKVELSLQGAKVEVDCAEFQKRPKSIKEYEEAVAVDKDLVGYFKSDSPRYPVLDSILRFKLADKTEVVPRGDSSGDDSDDGRGRSVMLTCPQKA
eukprot:s2973_g10.t1